MRIRTRILPVLVFASLLPISYADSAPVAWDGDTDLAWATPTNWDGNSIPLPADDVTIDHATADGATITIDGTTTFANLTIGGSNLSNGVTLQTSAAVPGFSVASGGLILIKSGTGATTIDAGPNSTFGLQDNDITVESGVTGTFTFGSTGGGTNRFQPVDTLGNGTLTSTFTNESDQLFIFRSRNNTDYELTMHSTVDGTVGEFQRGGSGGDSTQIRSLSLTGDARLDLTVDNGDELGKSMILTGEVGTELTNTTGTMRILTLHVDDTTMAGKVTGNLTLSLQQGATSHLILSNDDTYTGETLLGGVDNSNAAGSPALIREGTHVGGDSYTINGRLNNGNSRDGILGGSGTITLAAGATVTAERTNADAFEARAVIAPGNTGHDDSGVNHTTGVPGVMSLGDQGIGELTITADTVVFGDYGRFEVQVAGGTSDLLTILAGGGNSGDLDLSSTLDELFIDADLLGDADGSIYTLMTWAGTRTDEFSTVLLQDGGILTDVTADALSGFDIDGFEYQLTYGPNSLILAEPGLVFGPVVPEPAGMAMWLMIAVMMVRWAPRGRRPVGWSRLQSIHHNREYQ